MGKKERLEGRKNMEKDKAWISGQAHGFKGEK